MLDIWLKKLLVFHCRKLLVLLYRLHVSIQRSSWSNTEEYTEYDAAGNIVKSNRLYIYDDYTNSYGYECVYDKAGHLTKKTYLDDGVKTSVEEYDTAEHLLSQIFYNTDGTVSEACEYTYDQNGARISCKSVAYSDGRVYINNEDKFIYDDYGFLTSEEHYSNGKPEYTRRYWYTGVLEAGEEVNQNNYYYFNQNIYVTASGECYIYDNCYDYTEYADGESYGTKITIDDQGRVTKTESEYSTQTFKYDDQGRVCFSTYADECSEPTETFTTYNAAGEMISKKVVSDGVTEALEEYTYDDKGRQTSSHTISYGTELKYETDYDKNGRVTREYSWTKYEDDDAATEYATTYTYDKSGNRTKKESYEDGKLTETSAYVYNSCGDQISYTTTNADGVVTESGQYTYDKRGNRTSYNYSYTDAGYGGTTNVRSYESSYEYDDNSEKTYYRCVDDTKQYDENGELTYYNILKDEEKYRDDIRIYYLNSYESGDEESSWISSTEATYDASGRILTSTSIYNDEVEETTYTYDMSGNLLSEITTGTEDGETTTRYEYRYTYDKNGNLLTSDDGRTKTTYTYDSRSGQISSQTVTSSSSTTTNTYTYKLLSKVSK